MNPPGRRVAETDSVAVVEEADSGTDPDQTMWEVYVLHDDVPDWGEKDKKLKLLAPPFRALGVWGTLRRAWSNTFRRRATRADGAAALAEHAEPTGK